jgi:signal transduction histidine kinase
VAFIFLLVVSAKLSASVPDITIQPATGKIELGAWDPQHTLRLQGEWRALPGELLAPESVWQVNQQKEVFVEVGRSLAEIDPERFPDSQGYVTYFLILEDVPQHIDLGMIAPSVFSAAKVYWVTQDGKATLLHQIGSPGTNKDISKPGPAAGRFANIPQGTSRAAIVIQLSNFHHTWGGMWVAPTLASAEVLALNQENEGRVNFLLLGVLLFISFYNLSLYLRRREDRGSLWLAALSMGFVLRIMAFLGVISSILPSEQAFTWTLKVIYASMIWGPILGYFFLATYFPRQFKPIFARVSTWIGVPLLVLIALAPSSIFGYLGYPLIYIGGASAGFMCYLITRVFLAKEVGGTVCFLGMIALMGGTFLEMASALGWVAGVFNAMGYGLVIFVAFQSQIVAARFVQAFRNSERLSNELKKEVDRQTREIRSILDNIKQGIFTISGPLQTVGPQFSPFTHTILGKDEIGGKDLDDLLWRDADISSDQIDQVQAALSSMLGDDVLNYEMNSDCFPKEVLVMGEDSQYSKVLEMDWNPIVDHQQKVEKLLVCVRDVTELRQLRLESERNQREFSILNEIVTIAEDRFVRFVQKAYEYLQENEFFINKDPLGAEQIAKRIFVNYHTLKGTARTYQLRFLASETHEVEHVLTAFLKGQRPWSQAELNAGLVRITSCLQTYEKVAREKLHWNLNKKTIKMDREDLVSLLPHLRELETEVHTARGKVHLATLGNRLLETVYTRLTDIVYESSRGMDSIARDLGKKNPEITQSPNQYLLVDDWADRLHGTVTHILRNAIDHGIEKPDERRLAGKEARGNIFVRTQEELGFLKIEFQDDGRGLNLEKIEALARERDLLPQSATDDMSIALCIFHAGFTTKDAVTEYSGRGVGMNAVRSYIEEHGGRVTLELDSNSINRQHVSFSIQLFLPPKAWVNSQLIEEEAV